MIPGLVVAVAVALAAQDPVQGVTNDPAEEITARLIQIARDNASHARVSDGTQLPAATEEDRRRFAIPARLELQTVRRGLLTGQMEYCGSDGINRSFLPYMARLRSSGRYSDRQLAYIGFLHGISQGFTMDSLQSLQEDICSDRFRAELGLAAESDPVDTP